MSHLKINENRIRYLKWHRGWETKDITEYFVEQITKKEIRDLVVKAVRGTRDISIPTARVAPLLEEWIEKHGEFTEDGDIVDGYLTALGGVVGLSPRVLYRIRELIDANVTFTMVDRILLGLEKEHLWKEPPENGGFSDFWGEDPPFPATPSVEQERVAQVERDRKARKMRELRDVSGMKCSCGKRLHPSNQSGMCKVCICKDNTSASKTMHRKTTRRLFGENAAKTGRPLT